MDLPNTVHMHIEVPCRFGEHVLADYKSVADMRPPTCGPRHGIRWSGFMVAEVSRLAAVL